MQLVPNSGQVDGSRKPNEKRVENLGFQTRRQIFLICLLIKQENHMTINNFIDNRRIEYFVYPRIFW